MRHCQYFSAEVIEQSFLQSSVRVPQIEKRACGLVHARIEDNLGLLEVLLRQKQLPICDLYRQPLLQGYHLCLVVLFNGLRQLEDEQTCINLINVLI